MDTLAAIRPELLTLSPEQLSALCPYLVVFGVTVLAILAAVLRVVNPKWPVVCLALIAAIGGIAGSAIHLHDTPLSLFNGMMISDSYSHFFNILFLASAGLTMLGSVTYLDREKMQHPEYYLLILFSALGMMLMASALDLIVVFIALEIMSLSVYVLVGFRRSDRRCNEAAMKYFVLGSAASAVLLYGTALLYGSTGSTNLHVILDYTHAHAQAMTPVYVLGAWLVIVGFLFKVASVPFHMWMPDVYEGAPAPVTGFMTTGLKAAAFATFLRVLIGTGYGRTLTVAVESGFHDIVWVIAALTMLVGNVVALTQTNLKRMLGYSSIAHTGYLLVGMLAGARSEQGYGPVVMYLVVYAIMNLGAFAVLTLLSSRGDSGLNLNDISGLSRRHPWLSFAMAVFLFSMAGIPPTAGFAAKYMLFYAAIQANEIPLVILSVLCSAISVYYYLRVIVYMYMRDPATDAPLTARSAFWPAVAVTAMVALTLQIGIVPSRMVEAAKHVVSNSGY